MGCQYTRGVIPMKESISRRRFLEASLLGGAGATFFFPASGLLVKATESRGGICVTLCNHWSYTGIGWPLGLESCVLSATDAMEMADRAPHVKTCLELDALAYKLMAERFPEVAARLKKYLAADKVEVIGGTYGQPLGTMFTGESNIRRVEYHHALPPHGGNITNAERVRAAERFNQTLITVIGQ